MSAGTALAAILIGIGSGVISGMLGVGGGILMVPSMVLFLGMTQHLAEGTSLLVIIPTALVGAFVHWRHGLVLLVPAAVMGAGGIAGAVLGSHIALSFSGSTLRTIFVVYLIAMGLRMIFPPRKQQQPG
ncbi:MAG TPA: sulfite exporter TauE/SafE family protein [Candidatus Dormibacteraeota bacterium]|nr:sulfite exporter TauE/SafE family protein [Candidatus Dormibacteraeota bacterium]